MHDFAFKISKILSELYPGAPLAGGDNILPAPSPSTAYGCAYSFCGPPTPQS